MKKGFTSAPIEQNEFSINETSPSPRTTQLVRGFTLIELLIVIGVLAVISVMVTLIINPAEKFREARDVQRIADLRTLREVFNVYIVNAPSPNFGAESVCVSGGASYAHTWRASVPSGTTMASQQPFISSGSQNGTEAPAQVSSANLAFVDGTGWIPINFTVVSPTPIARLPVDPLNTVSSNPNSTLATPNSQLTTTPGSYYYAYQCFGLTYEIDTNMESVKYSTGGSKDVESKDGGTQARYLPFNLVDPTSGFGATYIADQIYQVGNDPGLDL